MSDHDNILSEFTQITGADTANAKFFLESAAWNLEIALASFYEAFGTGADTASISGSETTSQRVAPSCSTPPTCRTQKSNTRLGTMAGIRNEEREDDEREAFYAGGSVHSGQQVLGPENSDEEARRRRDAIAYMLRAAAHEQSEENEDLESMRNQPGAFSGVGYRLGQTSDDTTMVFTTDDGGGSSLDRREVTLKLWKQGFCVEDGPLREYTDPQNVEFLSNIRAGNIPDELLSEARGGTVHLNMEDHRHELYILPKPKIKAFAGKGHVLGSPTPVIAISNPGTSILNPPGEEQASSKNKTQTVEVNQQRPITNIQVRLADGSRLHVQLNHSHTIGDLRRYIASARSQYAAVPYTLLTTFPSKELHDDSVTLEEAGILNSSILQRLT